MTFTNPAYQNLHQVS